MLMGGDWREPQGMDNDNRYGYNGKELDSDIGLNWHHYGARLYLPEIGRFTGVDPIADEFAHVSAYNYAENSPISNIDLHGLQASLSVTFTSENQTTSYETKVHGPETTYSNQEKYGTRGTLHVTHNLQSGEITEDLEISVQDQIMNVMDGIGSLFDGVSEWGMLLSGGEVGGGEMEDRTYTGDAGEADIGELVTGTPQGTQALQRTSKVLNSLDAMLDAKSMLKGALNTVPDVTNKASSFSKEVKKGGEAIKENRNQNYKVESVRPGPLGSTLTTSYPDENND
jgi:RHS repeat-associated protein